MNVTALPTPDSERRKSAVATLRSVADEIERGELVHAVGCVFYPGGEFQSFRTRTVSRHEMVGILVDAMVKIVPVADVD